MECRIGCGACCIEPSIAGPIPGMEGGKPAGVRCVNLDENNICRIWNTDEYPPVCRAFTPTAEFCGESDEEAMRNIREIEEASCPV